MDRPAFCLRPVIVVFIPTPLIIRQLILSFVHLYLHFRANSGSRLPLKMWSLHILEAVKREIEAYDSLYSRWTISCNLSLWNAGH